MVDDMSNNGKAAGVELVATEGGVCAAQGIRACGVEAGIRHLGRPDLALVAADGPVTAAGTFTRNIFCAAPVTVSRAHLANGSACAVILNSGIANAATGKPGLENAERECELVAQALGCEPDDVLVCSTGVIGMQLDTAKIEAALPQAVDALSATGGHDAAEAIRTTDTHSKEYAVSYEYDGVTYTVGGMVKGSGMIMPDMATMLSVVTTDAPVSAEAAQCALRAAVDASFNKVTVDSDTSTNDTYLLLATGAAKGTPVEVGSGAYEPFAAALACVCEHLAQMIARDGEGATKLVTVQVTGAASEEDAELCARTIANSPLVKTAVAGHDANWGRIAAAAGRSGAKFRQEDVDIRIVGVDTCRDGLALDFDEDAAKRGFEEDDILIEIDLGAGGHSCRIWTCDLTHGYISINADYRT